MEKTVAEKLDQARQTVKEAERSIERSKQLVKDLRDAQRRRHSKR